MRTPRKGIWLLMQPRSGARVRLAGLFVFIVCSVMRVLSFCKFDLLIQYLRHFLLFGDQLLAQVIQLLAAFRNASAVCLQKFLVDRIGGECLADRRRQRALAEQDSPGILGQMGRTLALKEDVRSVVVQEVLLKVVFALLQPGFDLLLRSTGW